jgi:hypothetical protein
VQLTDRTHVLAELIAPGERVCPNRILSSGLWKHGLRGPVFFVPTSKVGQGRASLQGDKMEDPTKEEVIHRAYELWEQAGKPEGRDKEFYRQAEQELRNADKSSPERTTDGL